MDDPLFTIPFHHYSQGIFEQIRQKAERAGSSQLADPEAYIKSLVAHHRLTEINIDWDSLRALPEHREEESYVRDMLGDDIRQVTPVYSFEVQFSGSSRLLDIQPSTSKTVRVDTDISDNKIIFEIEGTNKSKLDQIKEALQFNTEKQKPEVSSFNNELEKTARAAVGRRKKELDQHDDGLSAFGVPIKGDEE